MDGSSVGIARALLAFVGVCAAFVAEFNLYGVPMLERSAMNPKLGFGGASLAVICFVVFARLKPRPLR